MKSFLNKLMNNLRYGSESEDDKNLDEVSKEETTQVTANEVGEKNIATTKYDSDKYVATTPDNIVELNEISIQAIINAMSPIKYSDVRLSEIHLHLRKDKQDATSLAAGNLFESDKFMKNLKYKLTDAGIKYMDNIKVKINYLSVQVDNFTKLAPDLSIQALTFEESKKLQKLSITALTGILWKSPLEFTPRKKPYFIGRCKMPELDRSARIINDIAFVGPEENDEPQYEINRYVSRSIAKIVYNEKNGTFDLMRSNLINNNQHKIKIVRILDGVKQISINNTEVGYPLQDDDQIVFNDKVSLLVNVLEMESNNQE